MASQLSNSLYLGIDLGTQSLKAVIYCPNEQAVVASASSPLDVDRDSQGKAEQNADDWLQALHNSVKALPSELKGRVAAVGVSGQQHGFVPVDAEGKVLAPVKLWCDTATQNECDQIHAALGGLDEAIRVAGNPIMTGYTAPKILWLKNHHPELYAKMAKVLLPHDYLNFVLTNAYSMEYGDASGTALLNVRTRQWSQEVLKAIDSDRDWDSTLPSLFESHQVVGEVQESIASELGLPAGIPVSTGGGDNMMAAIGTGNVSSGAVTISLGTSGTVFATADQPVIDPEGASAAFCSSTGQWLPLLCTMNCTVSTELMRGLLDISIAEFDGQLGSVPATCDGLLTLPFFNGERTPNLPNARGTLLGVHSNNLTPAFLLRSAAEGATYALRYGLEKLIQQGLKPTKIILTGGGSKSAEWRQMVADICQLPVVILQQDEGAALGAALQSLWATTTDGTTGALEALCEQHLTTDAERCCAPNADLKGTYDEAYQRYLSAVDAVSKFYE